MGDGGLKTPTFGELMDAYPALAEAQRGRTGGSPCERRVETVLLSLDLVLRRLGWPRTRLWTDLDARTLDGLFESMKASGLSALSAKSYLEACRGVAARWTILRWAELGFEVKPLDMPSVFVPPKRYRELAAATKRGILDLYAELKPSDPEAWFFATMMLKFGMRNSDVRALAWDAFREEQDGVYLTYVPHKTRLTSGRVVHWPVDDGTWADILEYRKSHPLMPFVRGGDRKARNRASAAQARLRKALRGAGLSGGKSAYELRKMCASAVYRNFGQEMVSSLLGDDISTILKHYADPSSVGRRVDVTTLMR